MADIEKLKLLRAPFAPNQISKLPKPFKKDAQKGNCRECGGYHGLPAAHLDYVGHAALTDRLLDADPEWTWEPVALDERGFPQLDEDGGMWIKLTVCGVTRLGYGDAQGKTGSNATKERIGDALRNAAMRFGAALDLWHKGELHQEEEGKKDAIDTVLSDEKYKAYSERIRKQLTKESAKAVWQQAVKECASIGDVSSANLLKAVMMQHASSIDSAKEKEVA
jgi:hypothetical protein